MMSACCLMQMQSPAPLDSIRPSLPFPSPSKNRCSPRISLNRSPITSRSSIPKFAATLRMSQSTSSSVAQQQRIVIPNKHGEKLVGLLHETGSSEVVILCHGFRSDKENNTMVNLAAALEKEGISAFRFDFAGNGYADLDTKRMIGRGCEVGGLYVLEDAPSIIYTRCPRVATTSPLPPVNTTSSSVPDPISAESFFMFDLNLLIAHHKESEGTFEYGNYWREADDLRAVIEHFNGANRVTNAIVGHSKGGGVVLLYASKYKNIHTVVNISGRYDLKGGMEERLGKDFMQRIKEDGFVDVKNKSGTIIYRVTWESLMDRLNTNMHEACLKIDKSCRVLTVHGSADEIIPVADAQEFAKIIPSHKLHIIEGANHCYTSHQAELTSIVSTFIKQSLEDKEKKSSQ